jgi:hypothetical protein
MFNLARVGANTFVLFVLFTTLFDPAALAADVKLAWDANPEEDIAGYRLYYGTSSKVYDFVIDFGNNTNGILNNLEPETTYYIAATAYDTQHNESGFSAQVVYTVPSADTDADGVTDDEDAFPADPQETRDTDRDGVGDNTDEDDDDDGMPDDWESVYGLNPYVNDASKDLDGDGISNLIEYLSGREPNVDEVCERLGNDCINLNPIRDFVTRFYQECLDRDPDPSGLEGWSIALVNHDLVGADVAEGFIYSPEFLEKNTTNAEYLNILYRAFFNREPDPAGWNGWLSVLNTGTDRGYVLDGFLYSIEFDELCHAYDILPN